MSSSVSKALSDLDHEFANTRRMLERVPFDRFDFKLHDKSWPLGKLALHLTDLPALGTSVLTTPAFDFAAQRRPETAVTDTAGLLGRWDKHAAAFKAHLETATDSDLLTVWTATAGDRTVMQMPRIAVLRSMILNHMVHHRAQLTIYFRLAGIPVPGLYGPSADEA